MELIDLILSLAVAALVAIVGFDRERPIIRR